MKWYEIILAIVSWLAGLYLYQRIRTRSYNKKKRK